LKNRRKMFGEEVKDITDQVSVEDVQSGKSARVRIKEE